MINNKYSKGQERLGNELSRGFSLIELLVVISLVAVFLMLAAPSLTELIQKNRVSSSVGTFMMDLKVAKSAAMKRGQAVTVCASSDGLTCLESNQWHRGWIVFNDVNSSGTVDTSDSVIRVRSGWAGGDTFVGPSELTAVTFGRTGLASNLGEGPFTLVASTVPAKTASTQCVVLNQVGNQTLQTHGTGCDVSTN